MTKAGNSDPTELAGILQTGKTAGKNRSGPADCGHFNIRIARDGTWYYQGSPIGRKPLVKLFSTVLKRDDSGQFWLETPVEKGRIDVDDAAFTAVEMTAIGGGTAQQLKFRTNLDEWVTAGPAHPICVVVDPQSQEPSPYVRVRDGMDALIVRPVFYDLVNLAVEEDGVLNVWSSGEVFPLGAAG